MSEVKEIKDSIELQLKSGFGELQKKYDAAMEEVQKGNQVTGELKKQIEDTKGELQKVIDRSWIWSRKASNCAASRARARASST